MISGNLFTRDYLLEGITRTSQWAAVTAEEVEQFRRKALKHAQRLTAGSKPNEAQTEKTFIYPVLEELGWTDVEVQQTLSTRGRKQVPDAILFGDTAARDQAVGEKDQWKRYQYGLAVVEAKRWLRQLDRADKKDADEEGVPSTQMMQYLSRVDVQTSGKVRLGILTNGQKWRLYFQGALSISDDYFEVDLAKALELPGHPLDLFDQGDARLTRELKLFLLLFGKQAFLPVDGSRTFHDISRDAGRIWEEKLPRTCPSWCSRNSTPCWLRLLRGMTRTGRTQLRTLILMLCVRARLSSSIACCSLFTRKTVICCPTGRNPIRATR